MAAYFVGGLLGAAVLAGVVIAIVSAGGGSPASSDDPFGQHYEGLEERRAEAGVPTMAEGGGEHFHPHLEVHANGERMTVLANIGIDPAQPPALMAGLHTHDESGTIHNEAGSGSTLGQFFAVWGVPFSQRGLGPYQASGSAEVRMWVDGRPSRAYQDLKLADRQQILVAYGSEDEMPPGLGR